MQLIEWFENATSSEESPFRQQLLREDIARLRRVKILAGEACNEIEFVKTASMVGWTNIDLRTHELEPVLRPLLMAFYREEQHGGGSADEVKRAWRAIDAVRLERFAGCLARVPKV